MCAVMPAEVCEAGRFSSSQLTTNRQPTVQLLLTLPCPLLPPPTPTNLQVRFFEVSEGELEDLRERFTNGQYDIDIEHKTFSMAEYNTMLDSE